MSSRSITLTPEATPPQHLGGGSMQATILSIASLGGEMAEPVSEEPETAETVANTAIPSETDSIDQATMPVIEPAASVVETVSARAVALEAPRIVEMVEAATPNLVAPSAPGLTQPVAQTDIPPPAETVSPATEPVAATSFLLNPPMPRDMPEAVRERRRVAAAEAERQRQERQARRAEAERQRQAEQAQARQQQAQRAASGGGATGGTRSAASAPSSSAPSPRADSGAAAENYAGRVIRHLRRHQRYPAEARRNGIRGAVSLRFTLASNGSVTGAGIARGSGHAVLDQEVMRMVRRANPFPAIPASVGRNSMSFTVTIRFRQ